MNADATFAHKTRDEETLALPTSKPGPIVVGFWRRLVADIGDTALLAAFGFAVTYPFRYTLSSIGVHAMWFGLIVSLLYYSLLHTSLGGGQTLGKRVLGIQVLSRNGEPLPFAASLFRYLVIAFIFYNSLYFTLFSLLPDTIYEIVSSVWFILLIGMFFACFFLIPLHPLKRGLHDLVAGSIVVYKDRFDARLLAGLDNPKKTRRAFMLLILFAILLLTTLFLAAASFNVSQNIEMDKLVALHKTLNKTSWDVRNINSQIVQNNGVVLVFKVFIPLETIDETPDLDSIRQEFLKEARKHIPPMPNLRGLRVHLASGYNTGLMNFDYHDIGETLYPPQATPELPDAL